MAKSKSRAVSAPGSVAVPPSTAKAPEKKPAGVTVTSKLTQRSAPSVMHPYVEGVVNPWISGPLRLPDDFKAGTTALKLVEEYTVASTTDGFAFFGVSPGLQASYINPLPVAGVAPAVFTWTQHQDYASYVASHANGRVLMYTVEVSYIGAVQTSAGRICCVNSLTGTEMPSVVLTTLFDDAGCVMPCREGMRCIQRPYQEPRMEAIAAVGFGTSALSQMYFACTGLPVSTTVFDVRITKWLEAVPLRSSIMRGMAVVEPGVPLAVSLAGNVGTDQADTVANNASAVKEQVSRARKLAELAWKVFAASAPMIGVPSGVVGGLEAALESLRLLRS